MTKVIILEFRKPTKREKNLYGETVTEGDVTRIFVNSGQSAQEQIDTLFHEFAHAFIHMSAGKKPSKADQERIASLVGKVAAPCFRRY